MHLVGILLFLVYWLLGAIDQNVGEVIAWFVPVATLLFWLIARKEFAPEWRRK